MRFPDAEEQAVGALLMAAIGGHTAAEFDELWDEMAKTDAATCSWLLENLLSELLHSVYTKPWMSGEQADTLGRKILEEVVTWYPHPPSSDGLGLLLGVASGGRLPFQGDPSELVFWKIVLCGYLLRSFVSDDYGGILNTLLDRIEATLTNEEVRT